MLKKLTVGSFQSNCYIYYNLDNKKALVIDPGDELSKIERFLKQHELEVEAIFLTHGHIDHISALHGLHMHYPNAKVYIHEEDYPFLLDARLNLSSGMLQVPFIYKDEVIKLKNQDCIFALDQKIVCLHFPGHTPGSCMYAFEEEHCLFSGDVLFAGSIGRYDLPLGSHADTKESLLKIKSLDATYKLYPGHNEASSIEQELKTNPFLR